MDTSQQEYQNQPGGQEKFSAVPLSMNGRSMKMQDQGRGAKLAMQASLPAIESNLYSLQTSHVLPQDLPRKTPHESVSPDISRNFHFSSFQRFTGSKLKIKYQIS
ncbi:mCG144888, partial [Mus musculus]